jgi:hypothetical protein
MDSMGARLLAFAIIFSVDGLSTFGGSTSITISVSALSPFPFLFLEFSADDVMGKSFALIIKN